MKKITLLTLSTFASFALLGCGGDSSSPKANTNTGTGYYVDNAVQGVDYVCGTETGKTDKEGKFTFEKGQECKFSLAGIPLRTTSADKLNDGVKVVEDNPKVAQFLQSIDTDGDLSNGIEIDDKVLKALTDALANIDDDTTVLRNDTVLTTVVAEVGSQVEGVSGTVRTESEVQEHLTQTQTEITKELLAGKTFYMEDKGSIKTVEINQDATQITFIESDGAKRIYHTEIKGNAIIDEDGIHYIDNITDKYILGHDEHGQWKLYFSLEDAKKALESSDANGGGNDSTTGSYTVYGGNETFSGGFSEMPNSYTLLGKGNKTKTFTKKYKYYVIANENNKAIYIDAVQGSNDIYYGTYTTSNTNTSSGDTWQNLEGTPDGKYVSIGGHGYILIDASQDDLTSITIFGK